MKKLISVLLTLMMALSCVVSVIPAAAVTHGYVWGDANDDGDLSMKDVLLSRRYIAGLEDDTAIFITAADVLSDDDINAKDVLLLRRAIAGLDDAEENNSDGKYKVNELKLGGRNVARFTIVYPGTSELSDACLTSVKFAASEMKKYVKDACGVALNVAYSEDDTVTGYKIEYSFDEELGREGFILEASEDGDFDIVCGTRRAAVYATYSFLENIVGYRFLTDSTTYLYKSSVIDVPEGFVEEADPLVEYRGIGTHIGKYFPQLKINASDGGADAASKNKEEYCAYNIGGAVGTTYIHAHSFVYFERGFEHRDDDDLDSVAGGKQPCMTSEKTFENAIDFMYKQVAWRTEGGQIPGFHYTQISCSANDNGNYCQCANCKRVYAEEGSVSGVLIRLCNRVADKFCADYPDLDIYTAAYAGTHVPPKMTRPDQRVCICFCCVGCNNHSLRHPEECIASGGNPRLKTTLGYGGAEVNQSNADWMGFIKGWLELTDNVYFWYYTDNFSFHVSPAPNLFNFWDDIKYLTELGVKGFYLEGDADYINFTFEQLRNYLMAKIMWEPEMSEEEYVDLMDEFLMIYYGDGWRNIKNYIEMINMSSDTIGCWTNNFDYPWDEYNEEYFAEHFEEFLTFIDAADAAATTAAQKEHVDSFRAIVTFLGLSSVYERDWVNGTAETQATYRSRYEWLWNWCSSHSYKLFLNSTFLAQEGAVCGLHNFPSNASKPCDTMNWIFGDDWFGKR